METLQADVCVVGAGFAGLAAAHRLIGKPHFRSVIMLESRERVGGRVWDKKMLDGTLVSVGGTWVGKGQDRMKSLVFEAGLHLYEQYAGYDPNDSVDDDAKSVFRDDGKNTPYKGMFLPIGIDGLADLALAFTQLNAIAQSMSLDEPWKASPELDKQTLEDWISSPENVSTSRARDMLRSSLGVFFAENLSKVSLLGSMLLALGGGKKGFGYYAEETDTEMSLVSGGGMPAVADYLERTLPKGVLRKSAPVRRIRQFDDHVEIYSDDVMVKAQYVIVTAPPVLAAQIEYEPALPDAYSKLMQGFPPGHILRGIALYETPFWREKGYSGFSVAPHSPVAVSIDQCPEGNNPKGISSSYVIGDEAVAMMKRTPEDRQQFWLNELAVRFEDDRFNHPIDFCVTDWKAEKWSGGGMIGHLEPGILTTHGHVLHEPHGRIYWAGAERARAMHGLVEGAVLSGEETAEAVSGKISP